MDQILPPELSDVELEALRQIGEHPATHPTFHLAFNPGSKILATPRKSWVGSF
jgi:hypothetical protein